MNTARARPDGFTIASSDGCPHHPPASSVVAGTAAQPGPRSFADNVKDRAWVSAARVTEPPPLGRAVGCVVGQSCQMTAPTRSTTKNAVTPKTQRRPRSRGEEVLGKVRPQFVQ